MLLKIIACTFLFAASVYTGYRFGSVFKRRERYFSELTAFCGELRSDIEFSHKKLGEILESRGQRSSAELSKNIAEFKRSLDSDGILALSKNDLSDAELDDLTAFFEGLGRSGTEQQAALIEGYRQKFGKSHDDCRDKHKKHNGMYLKLGVAAGVLMCILII